MDKHSSLLQKLVNYGQQSLITLVPGEDTKATRPSQAVEEP
jgi:hypothetical protein